MYTLVKLDDTVRVPPERFGEDLNEAINNIVQKTFEGTIRNGDGGMYQKVEFEALTFNPTLQEMTDALICEIVEFGAFCHIGPLDALIHMSQIMNDYVNVDAENERIVGKENKNVLKVGDHVRARIVAISLNELSARESKIGLTMRQPALGAHEWLKEPKDEKKDDKKDDKKKDKKKKKKGKK
jgi:DNA-directed RNA polymerase subunit E'